MRPKKHKTMGSNELFRARLDQIINMKHVSVFWFAIPYDEIDPTAKTGRAAPATRS
jgi:IS5 family transposase